MSYAIVMFDCPSAGEEEMASKIEEVEVGVLPDPYNGTPEGKEVGENKEVIIMMVKHEVSY